MRFGFLELLITNVKGELRMIDYLKSKLAEIFRKPHKVQKRKSNKKLYKKRKSNKKLYKTKLIAPPKKSYKTKSTALFQPKKPGFGSYK